ncbi:MULTISPECIES: hypothetical protein [Bacillus amyloliquefaciens group]|uniref:hypothetical protein n=1 Tax=Bacillus amyloliquefaciens group TaxID=1938374 RepID=UPI00073B6CEB|nr:MULTISPECIES: hypothetical protein [Bacillus amyloliquefaciens group]KTF59765.1 hypothetical protein AR691_13610 [Bacillus amyloliquefaciens]
MREAFLDNRVAKELKVLEKSLLDVVKDVEVVSKLYQLEVMNGRGNGVNKKFLNAVWGMFSRIQRIAEKTPYSLICRTSKDMHDYLFPYRGRGFVRLMVKKDFRRIVLYPDSGNLLSIKEFKGGVVVVDREKFQKIHLVGVIEERWKRYAKAKKVI